MTLSASLILIVLALIFVVLSAAGRLPLWPAVLCLVIDRIVAVAGR